MSDPIAFTNEEAIILADGQFFRKKAMIMAKMQAMLRATRDALTNELTGVSLVAPPGFDLSCHQMVKDEHLEDFPYQYLDYPKHFDGANKFTFRTLLWWGHHVCCALLLEGAEIKQHKKRLVDRYHQLAGRNLELSLAPTLWEWKQGEGYTLPITHDRKARIAAVLSERSFMKIVRCAPLSDPQIQAGHLWEFGRESIRAVLPIIAP